MTRNEKTSARVAKIAARLLALTDYRLDVWINADPEKTREVIRSLCASALTQTADKPHSPRIKSVKLSPFYPSAKPPRKGP